MLKNEISEKIYKKTKSRSGKNIISKYPIGVFIAGVHPEDETKTIIGFSLCHKYDEFDVVDFKRMKGHGKNMAFVRAIRWADREEVEVPFSIRKDFKQFVRRCQKYYKDKEIVIWAFRIDEFSPRVQGFTPQLQSLRGCTECRR